VLKRFIETKVPPGTPDAVMAQTGKEEYIFLFVLKEPFAIFRKHVSTSYKA
jgi:hypothetical protein